MEFTSLAILLSIATTVISAPVPKASTTPRHQRRFNAALPLFGILSVTSAFLGPVVNPAYSNTSPYLQTALQIASFSPASSLPTSELAILSSEIMNLNTISPTPPGRPESSVIIKQFIRPMSNLKVSSLPSYGSMKIDKSSRLILVSLRGSAVPQDWINVNLHMNKAYSGLYGNTTSSCGIHEGFMNLAEELYEQLSTFVEDEIRRDSKIAGYQVRFTGHSLGGALSQLLALRLYNDNARFPFYKQGGANNSLNQFKVVAFASPMVFSSLKTYPLGDNNLIRVQHVLDPIPYLPVKYKHVGKFINIEKFDARVWEQARKTMPAILQGLGQGAAYAVAPQLFHSLFMLSEELKFRSE